MGCQVRPDGPDAPGPSSRCYPNHNPYYHAYSRRASDTITTGLPGAADPDTPTMGPDGDRNPLSHRVPPDISGLEVAGVAEAQRHVQFNILVPSYLPEGTRLAKTTVQDGRVTFMYTSPYGPFTISEGPAISDADGRWMAQATGGYSATLPSGTWYIAGWQSRVDIDLLMSGGGVWVSIRTFPVRCLACERVEGVRSLLGEELEAARQEFIDVASSLRRWASKGLPRDMTGLGAGEGAVLSLIGQGVRGGGCEG